MDVLPGINISFNKYVGRGQVDGEFDLAVILNVKTALEIIPDLSENRSTLVIDGQLIDCAQGLLPHDGSG